MFARALHFDEILRVLHHDVHIDVGGRIFDIAKVAKWIAAHDAHRNRGDAVLQDLLRDAEAFLDFLYGNREGDKASDNAGCSRTAIGFNHIAVHDDGVLAECGEIGCAAQRTAHQTPAVIQPVPRPASQSGTFGRSVALQMTRVRPISMSTDPSALEIKPVVILRLRYSSGFLSVRV